MMDRSHEYQFEQEQISVLKAENAALREQLAKYEACMNPSERLVLRLREKLAAAPKNAERYRWLKENCALGIKQNGVGWSLNTRQYVAPDCMKELDAVIDAAIAKEKKG